MGLDAVIFCSCIERKRLKVPHPNPRQLYVRSNGAPEIRSKDTVKVEQHDAWVNLPPCEHESMMAGGSFLGNMTFIEQVRIALSRPQLPRCPVLLGKVIYNGTHTGDYLTITQVQKLAIELQHLKRVDLKDVGISSIDIEAIKSVIAELDSLVKTSRKFKKPIAF